jgi:hypothetical protein
VPVGNDHQMTVVVGIEVEDDEAETAAKQDELFVAAVQLAEDAAVFFFGFMGLAFGTGRARHVGKSPGRPEAFHEIGTVVVQAFLPARQG